jgi:hypothetical protein
MQIQSVENCNYLLNLLFDTIIKSYGKIAKICAKINDFTELNSFFEAFAKHLSVDVSLIHLIFNGEISTIFGPVNLNSFTVSKPVKTRLIELFADDTCPITTEDVKALIEFKNALSDNLKFQIKNIEETNISGTNLINQQVNTITSLSTELENAKRENEELKNLILKHTIENKLIFNTSILPPDLKGLPKPKFTPYNFLESKSIWK